MLKKLTQAVKNIFMPMREAAGSTAFANEDINWTPLTNDTKRDLMPYDQRRMQDMAGYQWAYNPIANRIIELKVAHLLGGGVSWKVETDDQQLHDLLEQKIREFWTYPTNQMDKFLIQFVRELGIYGDVCMPMFSTGLGSVRIGYIPAYHIEDIIVSTDGRTPLVVKTTMNARGKQFFLKVIYDKPDEELFTSPHDLMQRQMATDGECFYFAINTLIGSKRGRSDLAASFDWIDSYEQFMFGEMERAHLSRLFLWDVTLNNADAETCKQRAKEIPKPQPNGVRIHNENEIWKAEAPSMGAYESAAAARLFRNHILAGNTIPEHWIGGGGDANRSTAEAMDDPTYQIFSMRQKEVRYMTEQVVSYVGREYFKFIGLPLKAMPVICVIFPEMNPKDNSKYAAAFQQLMQAMVMGLDNNIFAPETALDILNTISSQMGVDIDAAMELEKAQNAMLNQAQNDLYSEEPVTEDMTAVEDG